MRNSRRSVKGARRPWPKIVLDDYNGSGQWSVVCSGVGCRAIIRAWRKRGSAGQVWERVLDGGRQADRSVAATVGLNTRRHQSRVMRANEEVHTPAEAAS
jgi:hypothetical protein